MVPLVRPFNISGGTVEFPMGGKKRHNFIMNNSQSGGLLVENGNYVLVKRFTTPEERRRVVAAVWTSDAYGAERVGFENQTNYFHQDGRGMDMSTAKGLWAFLNSGVVDAYFRQFNGSTQVNAADLRYIRYPSRTRLNRLGSIVATDCPDPIHLDHIVEELLFD